MIDQLKEMGVRLKELREIKGVTIDEIADRLGISIDEYKRYEEGSKDFSFSVMYMIAEILNVDVINLLSGHSPKLYSCAVVRHGKGMQVQKDDEYDYRHLAYTFSNKKAEPFLVTIQPNDQTMEMHSHAGQEFNYVISGTLKFHIDEMTYELEAGDSVYFDSTIPHNEKAAGDQPVVFIAVVIK